MLAAQESGVGRPDRDRSIESAQPRERADVIEVVVSNEYAFDVRQRKARLGDSPRDGTRVPRGARVDQRQATTRLRSVSGFPA